MPVYCIWLPVKIEAGSIDDARHDAERIWREATTPEPRPRFCENMLRTLMMGVPQCTRNQAS